MMSGICCKILQVEEKGVRIEMKYYQPELIIVEAGGWVYRRPSYQSPCFSHMLEASLKESFNKTMPA